MTASVAYNPDDTLTPNRFGILEPTLEGNRLIPARNLDLVLVPLVAFDRTGKRLGMGKGYYDQTFAFLKQENTRKMPHLIGLAYGFQEIADLPMDDWDIPLYGIATEQGFKHLNF